MTNTKINEIRFMIPVKTQKLKKDEFPIEFIKIDNLFKFEIISDQSSISTKFLKKISIATNICTIICLYNFVT